MITKTHIKGDAPSIAVYSNCESYRYSLTRIWDERAPRVLFVMLNPSTATELQNDPTVERCERRARTLGYGAFCVCNIFAYRATDPKKMRAQPDPVGPENDVAIITATNWASDIVCAWGTHGAHLDRGAEVEKIMRAQPKQLTHLGLSIAGYPKHPLYIGYKTQPQRWDE
jgi:hypothetical protein